MWFETYDFGLNLGWALYFSITILGPYTYFETYYSGPNGLELAFNQMHDGRTFSLRYMESEPLKPEASKFMVRTRTLNYSRCRQMTVTGILDYLPFYRC